MEKNPLPMQNPKKGQPPMALPTCAVPRPRHSDRGTASRHSNPKRPTTLSYPKSSPTPHLPAPRRHTLEHILSDLESCPRLLSPSLLSSLLSSLPHHPSPRRLLARLRRLLPVSLLRRHHDLALRLLRLHASLGLVTYAHHLFDLLPPRAREDASPWNCLIAGYAHLGHHEDALALYHQMDEDGVPPDRFTFLCALKACAGIGLVALGEAVHRNAVRAGLAFDVLVCNALVDMYVKCGDIGRAQRVLHAMPERDVDSWNVMLTGCLQHRLWPQALEVWRGMVEEGHRPGSDAVSTILSSLSFHCDNGKQRLEIHAWVIRHGLERELPVANALIRMYSEKNELRHALSVFELMTARDLVSWNTIISAHHHDYGVIMMYRRMVDCGVQPNEVTFVSLLSACANLGMVEGGMRLFSEMENKYNIQPNIEGYSCMVNMLGQAGMVKEAYEFVLKMPLDSEPAVWRALLSACSMHDNVRIGEIAAKRLFDLEPDNGHNFMMLIGIYQKAGRLEDVEKVKKMMWGRRL